MLLPHRKHTVIESFYASYGRRLLRRDFAAIRVDGEPFPSGDAPTIAILNHTAWWDPIVALHLSHDVFRRDGVGIMEGAQLVRYPFFRRVGCFGITSAALSDARAVQRYALEQLQAPRRTLWIFPQGRLAPEREALRFRSGAARIALARPELAVIPVAIRYEHRGARRAECLVRIGPPVTRQQGDDVRILTERMRQSVEAQLVIIDAQLLAQNAPS